LQQLSKTIFKIWKSCRLPAAAALGHSAATKSPSDDFNPYPYELDFLFLVALLPDKFQPQTAIGPGNQNSRHGSFLLCLRRISHVFALDISLKAPFLGCLPRGFVIRIYPMSFRGLRRPKGMAAGDYGTAHKKAPLLIAFASKCYLRTKQKGGPNGTIRGQPGRKNHKRQRTE
jgi:hypothetical protein